MFGKHRPPATTHDPGETHVIPSEEVPAEPLEAAVQPGQAPDPAAEADTVDAAIAEAAPDPDTDTDTEEAAAEPCAVGLAWSLPPQVPAPLFTDGDLQGRASVGDVENMERMRLLPPKRRGPYRPDTIADAARLTPDVSLAAASTRGLGHLHMGVHRQDAMGYDMVNGWLVAAVADGVSNSPMSHLAADAAVQAALEATRSQLQAAVPDEADWAAVRDAAHAAVRAVGVATAAPQAAAQGIDAQTLSDRTLSDIAATTCHLLVVPLEPAENGRRRVTSIRISGDSFVWVRDAVHGWGGWIVGKETKDGMIDNRVLPLPRDVGAPGVSHLELCVGQALVLCTDGIGDLFGLGRQPVACHLFHAWAAPRSLPEIVQDLTFVNANGDDDRTAIVVWTRSHA